LEQLWRHTGSPTLRISEQVPGDGRALYQRALENGWEGIIAKDASSLYRPGKRTPAWRKLKLVHEQEFVVGGWTEPRQTRSYFGALLLGVHEAGNGLVYVGHTGTGFNERQLARLMKLLEEHETKEPPFRERPRTNERPHWVKPEFVVQVKFTEWTADGKLRHPVYVGLRNDKAPSEVMREPELLHGPKLISQRPESRTRGLPETPHLLDQFRSLEDTGRDGVIELPDGHRLAVTNLRKTFWPGEKLTKGDLFRYYVEVAPFILPAIRERPLVMKRYPNGIAGKPFYQHRAVDVPDGVRIEKVTVAGSRAQLIGGDLLTLLYMTQLATISQDPWFSRVGTPEFADYAALDLDPSTGVPFDQVLEVACWIRDELKSLGAVGFPKTSGASGLHIYVPLPPRTAYGAGVLFCQIVATVVAGKHTKEATIERSVSARGRRVYIDCLQNALGKTLATAYSARASEWAGVSTPLSWNEVERGVRREAFTLKSTAARLKELGDLWRGLRESKGVDLSRVTRYANAAVGHTGKNVRKKA
jgi:bifunctional non-homologous end joining protein LigD